MIVKSNVVGYASELFRMLAVMSALLANRPVAASAEEEIHRDPVLRAMQAELKRSMKGLGGGKGRPKPYFLSIWIQQAEERYVETVSGAVVQEHPEDHPRRYASVEVRLGSYDLDSSNLIWDKEEHESLEDDFGPDGWKVTRVPVEDDPKSIRGALWLLADISYKRALRDYQRKTAEDATLVREADLKDFTREQPVVAVQPIKPLQIDLDAWRDLGRKATSMLAKEPLLYSPTCWVQGNRVIDYFVNSEGTIIRTSSVTYTLSLTAYARAEDGEALDSFRFYYTANAQELPREADFLREAKNLAKELLALRKAAKLPPFTGPAILAPDVAGVLFHEALGHRLEGERQRDPRSGQTFKGKVGQKILPDWLSVADDPSLSEAGGHSLVGHFDFDNQGVPGRRTVLVDRGVLKNYLLSRTPLPGSQLSNGHGRAESPYQISMYVPSGPRARMAVLQVTSNKSLTAEEMKQTLIQEAKRQKKPFGLILKKAQGGDTDTYGGNYQAFRTSPGLVYKIDVDSGKETLVRGVEIVGTPLVTLERILAVGDEPESERVWNASCGAETGWVPVSTISPSILTGLVELQRITLKPERPPHLPSPFSEE